MNDLFKFLDNFIQSVNVEVNISTNPKENKSSKKEDSVYLEVLDKLLSYMTTTNVVFNERELSQWKGNSVYSEQESDIAQKELEENIKEESELIVLSIKNFMSYLIETYPKLDGKLYEVVVHYNGLFILVCDESISDYIRSISKDIEIEAKHKLGAECVYAVEVGPEYRDMEDNIEKIIDLVTKRYELDKTSFDNLKVSDRKEEEERDRLVNEILRSEEELERQNDVTDRITMRELYEILEGMNKADIDFPVSLCEEIMSYIESSEDGIL